MICFLGSMLSIVMLKLSIKIIIKSINRSAYMLYKTFKYGLCRATSWGSCLQCMFTVTLPFTKFACIILVHGYIILITCKMTREQLMSNMQKSVENTHKVHASIKLKFNCTVGNAVIIMYIASHCKNQLGQSVGTFKNLPVSKSPVFLKLLLSMKSMCVSALRLFMAIYVK